MRQCTVCRSVRRVWDGGTYLTAVPFFRTIPYPVHDHGDSVVAVQVSMSGNALVSVVAGGLSGVAVAATVVGSIGLGFCWVVVVRVLGGFCT